MKHQKRGKTHRTTINFRGHIYDKLREYADKKQLSISRAVSEILENYFDFLEKA